jgi:hypothetical protein
MADWQQLLRVLQDLGITTGPSPTPTGIGPTTTATGVVLPPPSTTGLPPGMGQAAPGLAVQQLIQQVINRDQEFAGATSQDPEYHPADLPEGLIEKLIKATGIQIGSLAPMDKPYLEQYLHPSHDILPRTDLRPTRGGPPAPMIHRLPSEDDRWQIAEIAAAPHPIGHVTEPSLGGMGKATLSEAPEYMSVYDKWDFDSPSEMIRGAGDRQSGALQQALDWIIKQGLQRVGEPFAVYERYPRPPRPMPSHERQP